MSTTNFGATTVITFPIVGSDFSSAPAIKVPATALQPVYLAENGFGLNITDAPVSKEVFLHSANGNETIQSCYFGIVTPGSAASATYDLLKNGVSILSAPITMTNATAARTKQPATVANPSLVNNDVLTVKIVMSTNTGAAGPYCQVPIFAAAAPV